MDYYITMNQFISETILFYTKKSFGIKIISYTIEFWGEQVHFLLFVQAFYYDFENSISDL